MPYRETSKHRIAFEEWYRVDRDFSKAYENLLSNPDFQAPKTVQSIYDWSVLYHWHNRADARDDEAERKVAKEAIKRKAAMLKRHADMGRVLQNAGLRYFDSHDKQVETGQQAISAITKGVEVERTSEGLPAWIVDLLAASDDELAARYNELLTRIGGDRGGDDAAGDSAPDA